MWMRKPPNPMRKVRWFLKSKSEQPDRQRAPAPSVAADVIQGRSLVYLRARLRFPAAAAQGALRVINLTGTEGRPAGSVAPKTKMARQCRAGRQSGRWFSSVGANAAEAPSR